MVLTSRKRWYSARMVSRQRRWQCRQLAKGCCITCGAPAAHGFCEKHLRAKRIQRRKSAGCNARRIGKATYDNPKAYERARRSVANDYARGMTSVAVAKKYQITPATVISIARKLGGEIRRKGTRGKVQS